MLKTYPVAWSFYLDDEGQFLRDQEGDIPYKNFMLAEQELGDELKGSESWDALMEGVFTMLLPFWYAFGFMHCKNVTLDAPAVSRQVRRQSERRGTPLLDFRVINIEPMKRVLREEGGLGEAGPGRALHICRGHFKDYRDGPGLFGKHKGVYWWEGQLRSSLRRGPGDADYRVKAP